MFPWFKEHIFLYVCLCLHKREKDLIIYSTSRKGDKGKLIF